MNTVTGAIEALLGMAQIAQTSGVVPIGPWAVALAVLVAGSQATLQSGVLRPEEAVEIDDLGIAFNDAMVRMRLALAEGPF